MKRLIESIIKVSTGKYAIGYYVSAFALSFTLAFYGLGQLSKVSFTSPPNNRSVQVVTLEHKIKTLESRINDIESGAYARRMASLVGGDLSSSALKTSKVINQLNGSSAEKRKELEKAKREYAKVTGHTWPESSVAANDHIKLAKN